MGLVGRGGVTLYYYSSFFNALKSIWQLTKTNIIPSAVVISSLLLEENKDFVTIVKRKLGTVHKEKPDVSTE